MHAPVFDPVTDADRNAERAMREMIAASFPDHGVLGEEFGETEGRGPWRWVLGRYRIRFVIDHRCHGSL